MGSPVVSVSFAMGGCIGYGTLSLCQVAFALFVTVVAALVIAGIPGLVLVAVTSAIAWCVGAWASKQLGGVTGDVYGAVIEVSEVAVLLVGVFLSPTSILR